MDELETEPSGDDQPPTLVIAEASRTGSSLPALLSRPLAVLRRARELAVNPRLRPWLLAIAAAAFVVLAVTSFRSLPGDVHIRPVLLLVLVLVATPVTLMLNALEYRIMAAALGHGVKLRQALHVSLVASIANYLPAPGGVAVRTAALHRRGSPIRSAISANVLAGLMWLGLTGIVAGAALLAAGHLTGRATAAAVAGGLLVLVAVGMAQRRGTGWRPVLGRLALVELATVLTSAARMWLALAAIGQSAPFGSATAISASAVLAALLGIFPAGLGLRELFAGGIATLVGVSTAQAIAATSVDRVAAQVGMALTALASGVRWSELRPAGSPRE